MTNNASLYGLTTSNRNFEDKYYWGKNQFNSSFPAALACYMRDQGHDALYIRHAADKKTTIDMLPFCQVFGSDLQTFPENLILNGSKTNLEQVIGNAVPCNMAKFVGECILEYLGKKSYFESQLAENEQLAFFEQRARYKANA